MRILFLKSAKSREDLSSSRMPLPEKMQLILKEHVRTAKTDDEREKAEKELSKLKDADVQSDAPKS